MTNKNTKKAQTAASDTRLADVSKTGRDTKLESKKTKPIHHEKPTRPVLERLELPKGALAAIRKSGGLKFSSRQIVIYPDGRMTCTGTDLPKQFKTFSPQKLSEAQVAELRRMLEQVDFLHLHSAGGQQPPDSYAYEIVAQLDTKSNFVEYFDGKIPGSLLALIQFLIKLIP